MMKQEEYIDHRGHTILRTTFKDWKPSEDSSPASCSLSELIEDELRDLWQWGYDREPREESVKPRLDAIMKFIQANGKDHRTD